MKNYTYRGWGIRIDNTLLVAEKHCGDGVLEIVIPAKRGQEGIEARIDQKELERARLKAERKEERAS